MKTKITRETCSGEHGACELLGLYLQGVRLQLIKKKEREKGRREILEGFESRRERVKRERNGLSKQRLGDS